MNTYDLVVIGGGPAGIVGATQAATAGKTVAVIDRHHELGGAGINTGTVPSKTLRETALALSGMRSRNLYGVDLSLRREATVADFLRHERSVKSGFNHFISDRFAADKIDIFQGTAAFTDANTVCIDGVESIRGEKILVVTGSSPVRPPIFPFTSPEVYDSDTILELDCVPKSLAVVGAGVIGSEYACTFAALGCTVHLIDGRDQLLPFLDAELSRTLKAGMEKGGIIFHWNEKVQVCVSTGQGVTLTFASGKSLAAEALLVAAGRQSNTAELNLVAAGIVPGERGLIKVDEHYRTQVPHIYAAGDVIGFPALASTSAQQARIAVRNAFNLGPQSPALALLPMGIYTIPEVGAIGETEESLIANKADYIVGRGYYNFNARGRIIGDAEGLLKLLFARENMKLLGVHAIGEQATELVHIGMIAMIAGLGAHLFDEACFNVPTLGALYKQAALDAMKQRVFPDRVAVDSL